MPLHTRCVRPLEIAGKESVQGAAEDIRLLSIRACYMRLRDANRSSRRPSPRSRASRVGRDAKSLWLNAKLPERRSPCRRTRSRRQLEGARVAVQGDRDRERGLLLLYVRGPSRDDRERKLVRLEHVAQMWSACLRCRTPWVGCTKPAPCADPAHRWRAWRAQGRGRRALRRRDVAVASWLATTMIVAQARERAPRRTSIATNDSRGSTR